MAHKHYSLRDDRERFESVQYVKSATADGYVLYTLTGVLLLHEKGASERSWRRDKVQFTLGVPNNPRGQRLALKHWATFVSLNSTYNRKTANYSGHAVDAFRLLNPGTPSREVTVEVDYAIRDSDAYLYRIGYTVTLLGKFV